MTAALASVNFYVGQLELQAQLRESQVQRKISKVQEACKSKLQEVHNGYTQVAATAPEACQALVIGLACGRGEDTEQVLKF